MVVGGTKYVDNGQGIFYGAGLLTYVFNPRVECYWPGLTTQYYDTLGGQRSDFWGMWVQGPDLALPRWYATATLTHGLVRAPDGSPTLMDRERILVLGGSETIPAATTDGANRTYEALVVIRESQVQSSELVQDKAVGPYYVNPTNVSTEVWNAPGVTLGTQEVDWLLEYPRCHLLTNGQVLVCSYVPQWGKLDHDTGPGMWSKAAAQTGQPPGTYSANWQDIRHDGSSVLFPNFGGNPDIVARLGGIGHTGLTTPTMETVQAVTGNDWAAAPAMPNTDPMVYSDGGRTNLNTVILPTGGLLVLGGLHVRTNGSEASVYAPLLFENGKWSILPPNPTPSRRNYHSVAVLLPDGRVLLGGGDDRDYDYGIFSPEYLAVPANRPQSVKFSAPAPEPDPATGAVPLGYGVRYDIECAELPLGHAIAKVVLTAPCSVTHHSDMHQRYVEMETVVQNGNLASFYVPTTEPEAPRGIYLLWLVTTAGAVSDAKWVVLR